MVTAVIGQPVQITDDDIIIIKRHQDKAFLVCCDCSFVHTLELSSRSDDLRLRFVRLDSQFSSRLDPEPSYLINPEEDILFEKCSQCGLVHRMEILTERVSRLRFKFSRFGWHPPVDIRLETYIERE